MSRLVHLHPYCVITSEAGGDGVRATNALTGESHVLSRDMALFLLAFSEASDPTEVGEEFGLEAQELATTVRELMRIGLLADGTAAGPTPGALSAVELAFHRQLRFGGKLPEPTTPEAPVEVRSKDSISLPAIERTGAELCGTTRRSVRAFRSEAVPVAVLAELLACSLGVVESTQLGEPWRPYPSGGACYPLDVYVLALNVNGLERRIYRYEPNRHLLQPRLTVSASQPVLDTFQANAMGAMARQPDSDAPPPVILAVTSVVERTVRSYQGLPYHLMLAELGAVYQTLYLQCGVLGLGGCALGYGDEPLLEPACVVPPPGELHIGTFAFGYPERE